jgi:hypothetical protein
MAHGEEWYRRLLQPLVQVLVGRARVSVEERAVAAAAFDLIGDLQFCVGAMAESLAYYERALRYQPTLGTTWLSAAEVLEIRGNSRKANRYYQRGAKLLGLPTPEKSSTVRQRRDDPRYEVISESEAVRTATEWLARGSAEKALRGVARSRGVDACRVRAMALSRLEKNNEALLEWENLFSGPGQIALSYGDWFFLSEHLWNSDDLWTLLSRNVERIENMSIPTFSRRQQEWMGPPEMGERSTPSRWKTAYELVIRCHKARVRGSRREVLMLRERFPKWQLPRWIEVEMRRRCVAVSRAKLVRRVFKSGQLEQKAIRILERLSAN